MDPYQKINQSLAVANNYLSTDRPNEAIELMAVVKRIDPDNENFKYLQNYIISVMQGMKPYSSDFYGEKWQGESLEGKSIEIFCDQGMGDTLQMLRYVWEIKNRWDCKIVLNCYAYYEKFDELMEVIDCVDEFVNYHVPCDYQTNIMCLPYYLYDVDVEFYYPAQFKIINRLPNPHSPLIKVGNKFEISSDNRKIGIAWKSNPKNKDLAKDKSISLDDLMWLKDYGDLYSLIPDLDFSNDSIEVRTLADTATLINQMDLIITVDTAVLHLAGCMGARRVFGLLHESHDPRWGKIGHFSARTHWYPTVRLFKQEKAGRWNKPIEKIKEICNTLFLKNN